MQSLQSALGVVAIVAIAFIISENRRAVPWRPVIVGLVVTFALALLMLKVPQTEIVFGWVNVRSKRSRQRLEPARRLCSAMSVVARYRSIRRARARTLFSRSRRCQSCW